MHTLQSETNIAVVQVHSAIV